MKRKNPVNENLERRLHRAVVRLMRHVRQADPALPLGPAQLSALSVLVFSGARSPGAIARAEGIRPPTMSRILAALAKARLVTISPDPEDSRKAVVKATLKAVRIVHEGRRLREEALASLLAFARPEQRQILSKAADVIAELLAGYQPPQPVVPQRARRRV